MTLTRKLDFSPFEFDRALVRAPATTVVDGLRDGDGPNPNYAGVCREHAAYVNALKGAGVNVRELPSLAEFPDSVFIEDPALVFPQGAIKLRPGASSRRGEVAVLDDALQSEFDHVLSLREGYADGGDMLLTSKGLLIGLSQRTDAAGAHALKHLLKELDIPGVLVNTPPGVLHFKSDCSLLDDNRVLSTSRLAASGVFDEFNVVTVPEGEEAAANALRVNDTIFSGQDYPRTIDLLDSLDYTVVALPTSEIAKIDAGLSCMSLRWRQT